jgi:hypothetical protein
MRGKRTCACAYAHDMCINAKEHTFICVYIPWYIYVRIHAHITHTDSAHCMRVYAYVCARASMRTWRTGSMISPEISQALQITGCVRLNHSSIHSILIRWRCHLGLQCFRRLQRHGRVHGRHIGRLLPGTVPVQQASRSSSGSSCSSH